MTRISLLVLLLHLAGSAHAVTLTLVTTNITIPAGTTFQMPLTATDTTTGPLKFKVDSISWKGVKGAIAPAANRSLVLNITGVDAAEQAFTGDIVMQLSEDLVPRTTARIIELANQHFYDGILFHRVVTGTLGQAGTTNSDGSGGSGVALDDQYDPQLFYNGFAQVGLAKSSQFFFGLIDDSADSQFFITAPDLRVDDPQKPSPRSFDFRYPLIGQVTRGFDILDKLLHTPVSGQTPLASNIINHATIQSDRQAAVLRLTCLPGFTGDVKVKVSARGAKGAVARQTINVKVVANPVNTPPFLGPIPSALIITQRMAASFPLTSTDVENDEINLRLIDTATQVFPADVNANLDSKSRLWLLPDASFTGTIRLQMAVADVVQPADHDTQQFDLTVVPAPATPTFTIQPRAGSLRVIATPLASRVKLTGTLEFAGHSDRGFGSNDYIVVTVGDPAAPVTLTVTPDEPGRATKRGVIRMKSLRGSIPMLAGTFDSRQGKFRFTLSNFNFPVAPTNAIIVGLTLGNDYGSNVTAWTESKPGTFSFPR